MTSRKPKRSFMARLVVGFPYAWLLAAFLVPFLIVVLGLIDNGIQHINWLREIIGMVQMFTPLWIIALVQWLILHIYLSRRTVSAEAASTSTSTPISSAH